jgi:hypothetical protein
MRSLGATAPFLPSADAGTIVGENDAAAVATSPFFRKVLLDSLFFYILLIVAVFYGYMVELLVL